jgi:hypothetical protein
MLCQIFKTGEHTDSTGNKRIWTKDDLDKICYQFENVHSTVPICVGHPRTNSPAYGWIKDVKRIGESLYCSFKDVKDEFKAAVKQGLFKNRSISLDKDLNIRHIAFLGAQAPAIKGLEEFCFVDSQNDCQTFNISEFQDIKEKEDNVENENLKEQLREKNDEILRLRQKLDKIEKSQKLKEFEDFAQSAIEKGNILPKHKESIVNILSVCQGAEGLSFSDGTEKSAVDLVKEFVNSLKTIDYQDVAVKNSISEKVNLSDARCVAKELEKIMKEKNVDLTTAFGSLHS